MSGDDREPEPFGYMHLAGGRYDRSGLPVSSAAELDRYSRLVSTVARLLYLREHPKRRRLPRHFDDTFDLRLTAVEDGSVVPVLVRESDEAPGLFPNSDGLTTDWHDRARKLINEALTDIGNNDRLSREFPPDALKELAQFGRSLQPGERIELADSKTDTARAVMTSDTRSRIQSLAQLDELEIETVLHGQLTGLNSNPQRAELTIIEDGQRKKVTATYSDPSMWSTLRDHMGFANEAPLTALTVIATQGQDGKISGVVDILNIELALPFEWSQRIAEIGALDDGWLAGGVEAPSQESIERVESLLLTCVDSGIERPGIFPSTEGGVQLEWRVDGKTVEIEIFNGGAIEAVSYQAEGVEPHDRTFATFSAEELVEFIEAALHE